MQNLYEQAKSCFLTSDPLQKVELTHQAAGAWFADQLEWKEGDVPELFNQLSIYWGLAPYFIPLSEQNPSLNTGAAQTRLIELGILKDGDWVIIVSDLKIRGEYVETVQMRQISTDYVC